MLEIFQTHPFWAWASLAVILLIAELLTGTTYLLWLGVAAIATTLLVGAFPMPLWVAFTIYGILSILSVLIGRKFFKPQSKAQHGDLNEPNHRLLNTIMTANEDFIDGIGGLIIGDTRWRASSKDAVKKGDKVKIHAIDGATLEVVKL